MMHRIMVVKQRDVREMHPWSVCSYFCVSPSDFWPKCKIVCNTFTVSKRCLLSL